MTFFGFDVQGYESTQESRGTCGTYFIIKGVGTFGSTRRVCTQHVHVRTQITRLVC